MDAQEVEEETHFDNIAFVIILLFILGILAPYVGVMEQCRDDFVLYRPYCVTVETWTILKNMGNSEAKICENVEITSDVRNTAISIVNESASMNVGQVIEIFSWVKDNIRYVSDPLSQEYFARADETLKVKAGDCDDQAILINNMINSVGGISQLVIAPDCNHAFSAVYVSKEESHFKEVLLNIQEIYKKNNELLIENFAYYVDEDGYWIIADPAGGIYLGDILKECADKDFKPICD